MIVAAYLHDVVEKTQVEADEIRVRFGPEAAERGGGAERGPDRDPPTRSASAPCAGRCWSPATVPVLIYSADRVANMRDWLTVAPERRPLIAQRLDTNLEERLQLWEEDLEELTRHDPELPFLAEMEIELRELRSTSPPPG